MPLVTQKKPMGLENFLNRIDFSSWHSQDYFQIFEVLYVCNAFIEMRDLCFALFFDDEDSGCVLFYAWLWQSPYQAPRSCSWEWASTEPLCLGTQAAGFGKVTGEVRYNSLPVCWSRPNLNLVWVRCLSSWPENTLKPTWSGSGQLPVNTPWFLQRVPRTPFGNVFLAQEQIWKSFGTEAGT